MKTTKATNTEIVEGMTLAARALGVSKADIRQAKMNGAPGFRLGNRIDLAELRPYFAGGSGRPAPVNPLYDRDGALAVAVEIMDQWSGPSGQAPLSFTPAFTVACWAVRGLMAMGGDREAAAFIVRGFMEDIRDGRGDELLDQGHEPE